MPRTLVAGAALAALLLVTACSSEDDGEGAAATTTIATTTTLLDAASVPVVASAGCDGAAAEVAPGEEERGLASGGVERMYLRHVPPAHDGTTPVPLVLAFHGYSSNATVMAVTSQLGPYGDGEGFVSVFPQGAGPVPRWSAEVDDDDITFVGDLLDDLEATLCVDTNRAFATGLSNGAFMASALGCSLPDRVAAVAPVAGLRDPEGCAPDRPVPVVTFHGTADDFVTYDGAPGEAAARLPAPDGSGRTLGDSRREEEDEEPGPTLPEIAAAWADRNGCGDAGEERLAADVDLLAHRCPPGAEVELYRVDDGGHTWPDSDFSRQIAEITGRTTSSIDATELMWEFFTAHPLRPAPG